ncbi:hypothetical protein MESS4_340185 [Mesorhizobium sp. STM 4661]|nr:hypothetical protein MESS4_340185 [Mesorhizobium sp. STM 4661]
MTGKGLHLAFSLCAEGNKLKQFRHQRGTVPTQSGPISAPKQGVRGNDHGTRNKHQRLCPRHARQAAFGR